MNIQRLPWVVVLCLLTAARPDARAATGAPPDDLAARAGVDDPLFRVFLKDGTSLVSYGEYARVGDRLVFSMPTARSFGGGPLHLVDIAADRVDWGRTVDYAESVRADRYLSSRAERDYTALTVDVERRLESVALTSDPLKRLSIVQEARKMLATWPAMHFGYKQEEIREMLGVLDETILDLRASTGGQRFDLALSATVEVPTRTEPLLPAPTAQELIEQVLARLRSPSRRPNGRP